MALEVARPLRIELFGHVRLLQDTNFLPAFRLKKASLLLAYLALQEPPQEATRARLCTLFWPQEIEASVALRNLTTTLSVMRKALEPEGVAPGTFLETDREKIRLNLPLMKIDVREFDQLLKAAEGKTVIAERAPLHEKALALYRGHLLEDCYDEWAITHGNFYRSKYLSAVYQHTADLQQLQEWDRATCIAERAVQLFPFEEEPTIALIEILARQGHIARAIKAYELLKIRLRDAFGTRPSSELDRRIARIKKNPSAFYAIPRTTSELEPELEPDRSPNPRLPVAAEVVAPGNLPHIPTSFVGREQESAEIQRIITKQRLLTLTGMGGCGKTRLAVHVGRQMEDQFPHGVWMAALASLADPTRLASTLAQVLGIEEVAGQPVAQTLVAALKGQTLLLILDNCEHLIEACAHLVAQLLRSCPLLKIVATSREALKTAGEYTYLVSTLSLPAPEEVVSLATLNRHSAIQLFLERAQQVSSRFTVTEQNLPTLLMVSRHLEGIPLAIELAATRVRSMTLAEISRRLDDRFRLLAGGDRTAMPRHQTLQNLIDWSYALLSEQERSLFVRLSVFAGGWTLRSAEAICAGEGIEAYEVMDLMTSLVDKSLALYDELAEGRGEEGRYRMLETLRQYGQERLKAQGEHDLLRYRHRDHFQQLTAVARRELKGKEQDRWLKLLGTDFSNLRAAMICYEETQIASPLAPADTARWLTLVCDLVDYWCVRGPLDEAREWLAKALAANRDTESGLLTQAYNSAGIIAYLQGDKPGARLHYAKALNLARQSQCPNDIARSLNNLALVEAAADNGRLACTYLEESLQIYRDLEASHSVASTLANLALAQISLDELDAAREHLHAALGLFRKLQNTTAIASTLEYLCSLALRQDDLNQAGIYLQECVQLRREQSNNVGLAFCLEQFALLAIREKQYRRAASYIGTADAQRTLSKRKHSVFNMEAFKEDLASARNHLGEASFQEAWQTGNSRSLLEAIREVLGEESG